MTVEGTGGVQRVLILGGGCGALAAAFALTDCPEDRAHFKVSVVQPGWRLGGKGASGRNAAMGQRIEEHGLHIWSGFYENAFWLMRKCYRELDRPASAPLATAFAAFRPRHYTGMAGKFGLDWEFWKGYLPHEAGLPGDSIDPDRYGVLEHPRSPWELFSALVPWAMRYLEATTGATDGQSAEKIGAGDWWLSAIWRGRASRRGKLRGRLFTSADGVFLALTAWRISLAFQKADRYQQRNQRTAGTGPPPSASTPRVYKALARRLRCLQWWARRKGASLEQADLNERSLFELAELFVTLLVGMLDDNVIERGFDVLDDKDLAEWLVHHGATRSAVQGPTMVALYCYIFAYEEGDPDRPRVAAGVAVRFAFRLILCSRGGVFWEMMAGMGDTVFAPLYEVLRRRGVEFLFFHRAAELRASGPGKVDKVVLERQARTYGDQPYEPLITVNGLPCWPSEPKMGLLDASDEQKAALLAGRRALEAAQATWPGSERIVLEADRDFDHVVLAASVGPLTDIAASLLEHSPRLALASQKLKTVATIGMQLWLTAPTAQLGWRVPPPILTSFEKPLDTWADMSQVLATEAWSEVGPRSAQYFCGALGDAGVAAAAAGQLDAHQHVQELGRTWLHRAIHELWPDAVPALRRNPSLPHPFRDGLLFDPDDRAPASLASQWFTANVEPSERYVLSLPGGTGYRLDGGDTGYRNLAIAGDWLRTGLNFGCVESAVIGGLQAARAICGHPAVIHGERDFP